MKPVASNAACHCWPGFGATKPPSACGRIAWQAASCAARISLHSADHSSAGFPSDCSPGDCAWVSSASNRGGQQMRRSSSDGVISSGLSPGERRSADQSSGGQSAVSFPSGFSGDVPENSGAKTADRSGGLNLGQRCGKIEVGHRRERAHAPPHPVILLVHSQQLVNNLRSRDSRHLFETRTRKISQ